MRNRYKKLDSERRERDPRAAAAVAASSAAVGPAFRARHVDLTIEPLRPDMVSEKPEAAHEEEICLLGQPPLDEYLDFIRDIALDGDKAERRALVDEWRTANDYYYELEINEAGLADTVECLPLDPVLQPLADEVLANARCRVSFDTLPISFAMVELDKLVVCQTQVTRRFIDTLKSRLGPSPGAEEIFRFCFPLGCPDASVHVRRMGSERYLFSSESLDFRFHEPVLLQPEQISGYDAFGPIGVVVGLVVGFGSNFLSVIRDDNRAMLSNGYHRACALRELVITHAPCLIETVTRRDELALVAKHKVVADAKLYFKAARPPLLKDFFDPKIRKIVQSRKIVRMIEVSFKVQDYTEAE